MHQNGSKEYLAVHIIPVAYDLTFQALTTEIYAHAQDAGQPILLFISGRHPQVFRRPEDLLPLRRVKRLVDAPIAFVIPENDTLKTWATRYGFAVYSSVEEARETARRNSGSLRAHHLHTSPLLSEYVPLSVPLPSPSSQTTDEDLKISSYSGPLAPLPFIHSSEDDEDDEFDDENDESTGSDEAVFDDEDELAFDDLLETGPLAPATHETHLPTSEPEESEHDEPEVLVSSSLYADLDELPTRHTSPSSMFLKQRSKRSFVLLAVPLLLLLILGLLLPYIMNHDGHTALTLPDTNGTNKAKVSANLGLGVTQAPDGEMIGLSDGSYAFDTQVGRTDASFKTQASRKFRQGDIEGALSLWHEAAAVDSNDPETLIYLENQRVLSSGSPYISLVVGTMLTGTYVGLGRDDLQGAYVAQREYNTNAKLPNNVQVRILIASTGNDPAYATTVAQQIVQAAKKDNTIVGVMGWPYSSRTLNVIQPLANAHIPIVSQMASSVLLTGASPYFFRIVPPDTQQAIAGANFVEHTIHAKRAALFIDPSDAYSESIGSAFREQFLHDGNTLAATEQYTVGKPETLPSQVQDALRHNPDIIYFAGMAADANTLLTSLPTSGQYAHILVMGGDGLYEIGSYSKDAQANFPRLRFSAFAYPDEWGFLGHAKSQPPFFEEYPQDFDPNNQHPNSSYSYHRADGDAILSYDAVVVLLEASKRLLEKGGTSINPVDLHQALANMNGSHTVQGASGQIAFGPNGDPLNKAVVVLSATPGGIQLQWVAGQFFK